MLSPALFPKSRGELRRLSVGVGGVATGDSTSVRASGAAVFQVHGAFAHLAPFGELVRFGADSFFSCLTQDDSQGGPGMD